MSEPKAADELLHSGQEAFRRSAWSEAYEALSAADAQSSLGPEDLDALGRAAWCSGHVDESTHRSTR